VEHAQLLNEKNVGYVGFPQRDMNCAQNIILGNGGMAIPLIKRGVTTKPQVAYEIMKAIIETGKNAYQNNRLSIR
jgi:type II secretory pathway component PulC